MTLTSWIKAEIVCYNEACFYILNVAEQNFFCCRIHKNECEIVVLTCCKKFKASYLFIFIYLLVVVLSVWYFDHRDKGTCSASCKPPLEGQQYSPAFPFLLSTSNDAGRCGAQRNDCISTNIMLSHCHRQRLIRGVIFSLPLLSIMKRIKKKLGSLWGVGIVTFYNTCHGTF
jgi:hypothetical protein